MISVRFRESALAGALRFAAGEIAGVPDRVGAKLIAEGKAVLFKKDGPDPALACVIPPVQDLTSELVPPAPVAAGTTVKPIASKDVPRETSERTRTLWGSTRKR